MHHMGKQRTLSIVKPDGVRKGVLGEVVRRFEGAGIRIVAMRMLRLTKKDAEGLTEKYAITRVPTFVFLLDGKEIGRFVEKTPAGSTFEAEVAKILGGFTVGEGAKSIPVLGI